MAADPNAPYGYRVRDSDNDILRKILNWFNALGAGTRTIAVSIAEAVGITVSGTGYVASYAVTRANDTTAYTANDVVSTAAGENLEFGGIGPEATGAVNGKIILTSARLRIDSATRPAGMGLFRLHLFNGAPTALADNAAFNLIAADRDKYVGFIEFPTPDDLGDTLFSGTEEMNYPIRKEVTVNSIGNLYGQLQTVGAWTPAAGTVFTVSLTSVGV